MCGRVHTIRYIKQPTASRYTNWSQDGEQGPPLTTVSVSLENGSAGNLFGLHSAI